MILTTPGKVQHGDFSKLLHLSSTYEGIFIFRWTFPLLKTLCVCFRARIYIFFKETRFRQLNKWL